MDNKKISNTIKNGQRFVCINWQYYKNKWASTSSFYLTEVPKASFWHRPLIKICPLIFKFESNLPVYTERYTCYELKYGLLQPELRNKHPVLPYYAFYNCCTYYRNAIIYLLHIFLRFQLFISFMDMDIEARLMKNPLSKNINPRCHLYMSGSFPCTQYCVNTQHCLWPCFVFHLYRASNRKLRTISDSFNLRLFSNVGFLKYKKTCRIEVS